MVCEGKRTDLGEAKSAGGGSGRGGVNGRWESGGLWAASGGGEDGVRIVDGIGHLYIWD